MPSDFVVPAAFPTRSARSSALRAKGDAAGGHTRWRLTSVPRASRERPVGAGGATRGSGAAALPREGFICFARSSTSGSGAGPTGVACSAQRSVRDSPAHGDERVELRHRADSIVAWLRASSATTVRLTGMGFDWVEAGSVPRSTTGRVGSAISMRSAPTSWTRERRTVDALARSWRVAAALLLVGLNVLRRIPAVSLSPSPRRCR